MSLIDWMVPYVTRTHQGLVYPTGEQQLGGKLLGEELIKQLPGYEPPLDPPDGEWDWEVRPGYYRWRGDGEMWRSVESGRAPLGNGIYDIVGADYRSTSAQNRPSEEEYEVGQRLVLQEGLYPRTMLSATWLVQAEGEITEIVGAGIGETVLVRDPNPNGEDTLYGEACGNVLIRDMTIEVGSRSGFKTPERRNGWTGPNISLERVWFEGHPVLWQGGNQYKWAMHTNEMDNFLVQDCGGRRFGEHFLYDRNKVGGTTLRRVKVEEVRRCLYQNTNRVQDGAMGAGDFLLEDCEGHDTGHNGASLISFQGGSGDSVARVTRLRHTGSRGGSIMCEQSPSAHLGGCLKELYIDSPYVEGMDSDRDLVMVGTPYNPAEVEMVEVLTPTVMAKPGANAFRFDRGTIGNLRVTRSAPGTTGRVIWGQTYPSWEEFIQAVDGVDSKVTVL